MTTPFEVGRDARIAHVYAEMAAFTAARRSAAERPRRGSGPSVTFCLRLEHADLAALEHRAEILGIKPGVLARNLLRAGLSDTGAPSVTGVADRLDAALAELRALQG